MISIMLCCVQQGLYGYGYEDRMGVHTNVHNIWV
jgi:hypothetical protein